MGWEIYDGWLPAGYRFPPEFVAAVEARVDILPWRFFATDDSYGARDCFDSMGGKFPQGVLVPFAYLHDPTGWSEEYPVLANFDAHDNSVRIYATEVPTSSPWDNYSYANFDDWLASATEDAEFREGLSPDALHHWVDQFRPDGP